jgi:hypothetical protein
VKRAPVRIDTARHARVSNAMRLKRFHRFVTADFTLERMRPLVSR